MKIISTLLLILALIFQFLFSNYGSTQWKVQKLLEEMSLRDKVTQMLMVDFRYWD